MRILTTVPLLAAFLLGMPALGQSAGTGPCLAALQLHELGEGEFTLTWLAIDDAVSYEVAVREGSGDWTPLAVVAAPETQVDFHGVPDTAYHFRVTALDATGTPLLTFCSVSNATTPPPCPTNLTGTREGDVLVLQWDSVAEADGYNGYGPTQDGPDMFLGHTQSTSLRAAALEGTYTVRSTAGQYEATGCPEFQLTQVPFFPPGTGWLAGALGLGMALLVFRRR